MYRVCIDKANKVYKHFNTEEQAIAWLRETIEADKKYTFDGAGVWLNKSGRSMAKTLRWVYFDETMNKYRTKTKIILTPSKRKTNKNTRLEYITKEMAEIKKLFAINA